MLAAGNVERGMRVLEIGTGTGYTAALLAHYLGARNVTTIEVDPDLAARARAALDRAGYGEVKVITGDGARGDPEGAPFDQVISTVAAPRVPYAWVAQTRPGGLVNTTISFMPLRDQRISRAAITDVVRDTDTPDVSATDLHACEVCNDDTPFAIALQVPDCHWEYEPTPGNDGRWCVWFLDPGTRSWARFDYQPDTRCWPVHQFGSRRLFDEVAAAYHRWDHAGRPPATHWRFTITPDRQRVQLTDDVIRT